MEILERASAAPKAPPPGAPPAAFQAAPLAPRLAAFVVDFLLASACAYLLARIFPSWLEAGQETRDMMAEAGDALPLPPEDLLRWLRIAAVGGLWLTIMQTYFILAEWALGQTLGKAIFDLRVVRPKGGARPGFVAVAVRDSVRWLWDAHVGLALALPMMARGGRRLGDVFSGLAVVKASSVPRPSRGAGRPPVKPAN